MKKILFLTNKDNGYFEEEDSVLIDFLGHYFELVVSHPQDCLSLLQKVEGIIIRNIWPTHEYAENWSEVERKIKDSGLRVYNSLSGKGDVNGKDYLLKLFQDGYPIIPSVDRLVDISKLETAEYYWIKPKDGCDGYGSGKYTKDELTDKDLNNYIIQPYVEFTSEPSLFFIDNIYSHGITMRNRLNDTCIGEYMPSAKEIALAERFVKWNDLPRGIQRIDFVQTKNGSLLLTEIEDLCPYLYLDDVIIETRNKFLEDIRVSVVNYFR